MTKMTLKSILTKLDAMYKSEWWTFDGISEDNYSFYVGFAKDIVFELIDTNMLKVYIEDDMEDFGVGNKRIYKLSDYKDEEELVKAILTDFKELK